MLNFFKKQKISLGAMGEKAAATYLKKVGFTVICYNFTNQTGRRLGEIDIIAKDKGEIVFVEVKTRKESFNKETIIPEENITQAKLYKLKKIANYYIKSNNLWHLSYRFDAISLLYNEKECKFDVKHLKNIFL